MEKIKDYLESKVETFLDNHPRIVFFVLGWVTAPIIAVFLPR